jgi:hypothetical protein
MERRHQRTLAAMRESYQRDLTQTGPYAFRDRVLWTPEEDARLRQTMDRPVQELIDELGRSPTSLYMRRSRLRRQTT